MTTFGRYLKEERTPSPEKLMTQVYDMGFEDAEMGNPQMQNIRPTSLDRQLSMNLAKQNIHGGIIQSLYDSGYDDGKRNRYDVDRAIHQIMKQNLNEQVIESVQMGGGTKVTEASIYLDDDDTVRIEPRGNLPTLNLDITETEIKNVFRGVPVTITSTKPTGRNSTFKLDLEDDGTLCIVGIKPGRQFCIDVDEKELLSVVQMGRMLRNIPVWM